MCIKSKYVPNLVRNSYIINNNNKIELPYNPVIPLLGMFPKETTTLSERNISTSMFIAVSFPIAKVWEQPSRLSTNKKIKEIWST